ncbi:MAG: diaminopimelate decarboxylase [Armatimonadetes bacterium]|nr:diaminopimelate decarboxylase [Armatimonadota bacterium]
MFSGTLNSEGHLEFGGADVTLLAESFGTPLYVLDEEAIRRNCRSYVQTFQKQYPNSETVYAGKAFLSKAICRILEQEGLGLDVVSGGELYTALQAGFPASRVVFHGNNKSADELSLALENRVGRIVVDNFYELSLLGSLASRKGVQPVIHLRLTPGVKPSTHTYVQTGQVDSKFGFGVADPHLIPSIRGILAEGRLNLVGVHCHIGSQIFQQESYNVTIRIMMEFLKKLHDQGIILAELNLGGGLGIAYTSDESPPAIAEHVSLLVQGVRREAERLRIPLPRLLDEPGRSIVGPSGIALYRVGGSKEISGKRKYIFVDGSMADNPRVALYGARYEAVLANRAQDPPEETVTVAGKCCESGDILIWDASLPVARPGDLLAVFCTGAYHYAMASNYNRLPRPAVVLVNKGQPELIIRRETYEDLVRNDLIPERLNHGSLPPEGAFPLFLPLDGGG